MKEEVTLYRDLLGDIKTRIRQAQGRAARAVNAELVRLYWEIGGMILQRQDRAGWGARVIPRLAADLKNDLPEQKGFSERNLDRMIAFRREYPGLFEISPLPVAKTKRAIKKIDSAAVTISPRPVAKLDAQNGEARMHAAVSQLPWAHNVLLMQKAKDLPTRLWYAEHALVQGWSRDDLSIEISKEAHLRHGTAVTNFGDRLAEPHSAVAESLLKDPYLFDFLTMEEPFHERELETGLVHHLEKFLLELGQGFAFVGRQYPITVAEEEFYIDLLFYHIKLRCFIVIELKKGKFRPEYAGKMNFYCSVVDDLLRHEHDQPTIGLILCQQKDRVLAEYALRDINKPIGVSDYELTRALPKELATKMPSVEEIEEELEKLPNALPITKPRNRKAPKKKEGDA